jgi:hypothetical protein
LYGNEIDDYNKGGVYVDNVGSELEAAGNIVRGPDLSGGAPGVALAAPNGVQISRGADGDFHHNKVVDNVFPGVKQLPPGVDFIEGLEPGQASGITLFSPSGEDGGLGDVRVHQNLVQNNDVNLGLFNADRTFVQSNSLLDAPFYDGLYADEESEDNRFVANTALRNTEHDCHDDSNGDGTAGTANRWSGNRGETENRPGLCRDRGGHEDDDGHGGGHHRHARWR